MISRYRNTEVYMGDEWTTAWLQKGTVRMLKRLRDEARLKAWASGLPIISTDIGGIRRFVDEGETGKRVPPSTPAEPADAISESLSQPDRTQQMDHRSYGIIAEEYTWDRIAERTHELHPRNTISVRVRKQSSPTEAFTPRRLSGVAY